MTLANNKGGDFLLDRKSIDQAARRAWLSDVQRWSREQVKAFAEQHGLDLNAAVGMLGAALLREESAGALEAADETLLEQLEKSEYERWKRDMTDSRAEPRSIVLSGVETGALTLSMGDDPARPHVLSHTGEDGTTSSWSFGPLGLRALMENDPQDVAQLIELAGGGDDEGGAVDLSAEAKRTRSSIEDARLVAVELAAEAASDENAILITEEVSRYARRHGMTYPDAYQQLRSALSGALRRDRETDRRVRELAEEREISYADAAIELAAQGGLDEHTIDLSERSQGGPGRRWLDRPVEERDRLMREEAEKAGFDVG